MKLLPTNFYATPEMASMTMTNKDLKELLLSSDGRILACGYSWDIKSQNIGVGVRKVFLKRVVY